jgi:hypothetical protein
MGRNFDRNTRSRNCPTCGNTSRARQTDGSNMETCGSVTVTAADDGTGGGGGGGEQPAGDGSLQKLALGAAGVGLYLLSRR